MATDALIANIHRDDGAAAQTLRRYFNCDALAFTCTVNVPATPLPAPLLEVPAKPITRSDLALQLA